MIYFALTFSFNNLNKLDFYLKFFFMFLKEIIISKLNLFFKTI